jgi:predicted DNA-binding transcriptional regulator YafY
MPTNKNAQFRYRVIDKCLRNTARSWNLQDLIDELSDQMAEHFGIYKGISKRTVQYDLNVMRSDSPRGFGAPIVCKDGNYSYGEPGFSIVDSPLIESDIEQIQEAITILRQFKGLPHFAGLEQILHKIEGQAISYGKQECIQFETNIEVKGLEWLGMIYKAINNMDVLKIEYKPFQSDTTIQDIVHPYLLKEYHNRWFLIGFNESFGKISNYALDRINAVLKIKKRFKENIYFNTSELFKDVVGVTVMDGEKKEDIIFRATAEQAPYIITKPIHKSQKIISESKEFTEFIINVIPNFELEQVFLSHGEKISIVSPEKFKMKIIDRINNSLMNYQFS